MAKNMSNRKKSLDKAAVGAVLCRNAKNTHNVIERPKQKNERYTQLVLFLLNR
jgi:hypothetical protein